MRKKFIFEALVFLGVFFVSATSASAATVYVDPTCVTPGNGSSSVCAGAGTDPKATWASVTWTSGNTYLQKAGTTANETVTPAAPNVTIDKYGTGANPKVGNGAVNGFNVVSQANVTINNFDVVGNTNSAVIFQGASTNFSISNVTSSANIGVGKYDWRVMDSSGGTIAGCTIGGTAESGIRYQGSGNLTVNGNTQIVPVLTNAGAAVMLVGTGNVTIDSSTLNATGTTPNADVQQNSTATGNFTFTNNTWTHSIGSVYGFTLAGANTTPPSITISGNTISASARPSSGLISITGIKHNVVMNTNTINDTYTGHAFETTVYVLDQNSLSINGMTLTYTEAWTSANTPYGILAKSDNGIVSTSAAVNNVTVTWSGYGGVPIALGKDEAYNVSKSYMLEANSSITNCTITGPGYGQTSGVHGIGVFWNRGTRVHHNTVTNTAYGIVIKGDGGGTGTDWASSGGVYDNIINTPGYAGIHIKGAKNVPVYNNTIYSTATPASAAFGSLYMLTYNSYGASAIFKNNVVFNKNGYADVRIEGDSNSAHNSSLTAAYNDYWSSDGSMKFSKVTNTASVDYTTLGDWAGQGFEDATNSKIADPVVVSSSDFHLQSTSPAIDAGTNVGLTTDYAGNTVPSGLASDIGAYEFQDTTAPTVSLTAPASSAAVAGARVSLSATASDNVAVAGVTFYVDNTKQGSEDTASPYSITWDSTATANGSHSAFAVARDTSNNYATSTSVSFSINNGGNGPIFAGTAADLPGYVPPRPQIIYPDGKIVYLDEATSTTTKTITPPPLAEKQNVKHSVFMRALKKGSRGADVTTLQELLKKDTALYPEGLVTGYYGTFTENAVKRFQKKYGIVSSGAPNTTGYGLVGSKTRAKLEGLVNE